MSAMQGPDINTAIRNALADVIQYADELRDLDAALGDGDLGVTVSLGAKAVRAALEELPDDALPADIAKTCAKAFANANPSTMAALVAGALLAGSRVWGDAATISVADAGAFATAAGENIGKRGKSQVGDKTILDALMPAAEALSAGDPPDAALDKAIDAAQRGVTDTVGMQSRRGRASWLQERSIGLQDPGATAFLRFLQSWKAAN
ncbi:DAK2 domain-containing protein [Arthrobacter sp. MDT3-44]